MTPRTRQAVRELAAKRSDLLRELPSKPSGLDWCQRHTRLVDEVVRLIYEDVASQVDRMPALAVIATGGYGRMEMAPYSDVDLTVVPADESDPAIDDAVRMLFRDLHTAFGSELRLDVGYNFLLVNDTPGLDVKTRTGLLDARLVVGNPDAFNRLMRQFWDSFSVGEFLLAKVREREEAEAKYNDSPLAVEPHVKEGAGGLRSFQCANWLRTVIGERPSRPSRAYDTVLMMRNLLHAVARKRLDILSRTRQGEIAETTGADLYQMMRRHVEAAAELHSEYATARERLHEARFPLTEGVLAFRGEARISGNTGIGEAAVGISLATQLGLSVAEIKAYALPGIAAPEALYAVGAGEAALRNLNRCGLLERLLPELAQTRFLIPVDANHAFTVFEHTMRVVRHLDSLQPGSFLGDLKAGLQNREALYLAALLHDVGKADPECDHSLKGEQVARQVCRRWGLAGEITELVAWLVREHLTMSKFIRMRDVMNPSTVAEFAQLVENQERLDMLTLLTWADTSAVTEGAWTGVHETFQRELYSRATSILSQDGAEETDAGIYRQRILRDLKRVETSEQEVEEFLNSLPAHYVLSTPSDVVKLHIGFARKAREGQPSVEFFHQPEMGTTDVTVCCLDSRGLLSKVLGVLYALDLTVHAIRASTTSSDPPVAIDVFSVSYTGRPLPPATCKHLSQGLHRVLAGETTVEELLRSRRKDPDRRQQVFTFSFLPGNPGILEFRVPRGRGMAYRLSRLIAEQGWNILTARVGQWAGKGAAAFYVQGPGGRSLIEDEVRAALEPKV